MISVNPEHLMTQRAGVLQGERRLLQVVSCKCSEHEGCHQPIHWGSFPCCALQTLDTHLVLEIRSQRYFLSLLFGSVPQQLSATVNFSQQLYNPGQSDDPQYDSHFMSCLEDICSKLCNCVVIVPKKTVFAS